MSVETEARAATTIRDNTTAPSRPRALDKCTVRSLSKFAEADEARANLVEADSNEEDTSKCGVVPTRDLEVNALAAKAMM